MNYELLNELDSLHGDSFYLLDSSKFEDNYDEFLLAFKKYYSKTNIGYSYKTNYTPKLCKIVDRKGGYAEVVSDMEYALALKLSVRAENIVVNGPYKPVKFLKEAIFGGSIVNLDSYTEIELVKELAQDNPDKQLKVGIRCNFDIGNDVVSRFGIDVEDSTFFDQFKLINEIANLEVVGIHCHFPDRNAPSYKVRAEKIIALSDKLFKTPPKYIDVGGGYFGKMPDALKGQFSSYHEYDEYAENIASQFAKRYGDLPESEQPTLILEPGSAIVGDTVKFVSKIIDIKSVRGKFIAMSSGSKFNIGLLSSSVNMPIEVFSKEQGEYFIDIDISGFTCIESDYLYKGYNGPLSKDDYVVLSNVGSYSIVFKPPFILPNFPVLEMAEQSFEIVKRKETVEDIFTTFES